MSLHATSDHSHQPAQGRWFWIPLALGIVGALCGFFGQRTYDRLKGHSDAASEAYHTLQLFVLHGPHLDDDVPILLQFGRWLTALSVLAVVTYGLFRVFQAECLLLWTRWHEGHIVICGLGRLGKRLAQEFQRGGMRVVAVESSGSTGVLGSSVAVITGDASDPKDLRRAAVDRAKQVIVVCDDEQTNVAVAAAVGKTLATSNTRPASLGPLECWIFVPDVKLRQTFQQSQVFPHTGPAYSVNVRGLDPFELASRKIFDRSPLDFEPIPPNAETRVHLVIVGFGPMGQHLALQAAAIGHFANFQKLKITIVAGHGTDMLQDFQKAYPKFSEVCDLEVMTVPAEDRDLLSELKALLTQPTAVHELITIAFCWDTSSKSPIGERDMFERLESEDSTNLRFALGLAQTRLPCRPRFLVFQTRRNGFGALFPVEGRAETIGPELHAFGLVEEMYSLESLLHERDDAIAKSLHEIWYENQIRSGRAPGSRPALFPWDELPERFKDSNRQAADHIPAKLRAAGYRIDQLRKDQPSVSKFDREDQLELMARMEHERWCAEQLLQGFSYADVRDEGAKTQPYLVPWDKLSSDVQDYDRLQVRGIPDVLKSAGFGIYFQ
jgi:hypothetical protein